MPKITYPQLRDYIGKAIEIGGDIYGLAKTVSTIVSLFGSDYESDENAIQSYCDDIRELSIGILDRLTEIEREVDKAD